MPHNSADDVSQAASSVDSLRKKHDDLFADFQQKIESMAAALRPEALVLEALPIRPRKTDITVEKGRPGLDALSGRGRGASRSCVLRPCRV